MNSNETLTLHNSVIENNNPVKSDIENETTEGIHFYTNPHFTFAAGADAVSLENDGQYFLAITSLFNEMAIRSYELPGSHQEPTQLWQELETIEQVASRILRKLTEERSLPRIRREEIEKNLTKLEAFLDTEVPEDLHTLNEARQQRLKNVEWAVINARLCFNSTTHRKRFPRLRRMLNKITKRD